MTTDLEKARKLLASGGYTCVLVKGDTVYTSTERGVKPLLVFLDGNTDLQAFSAADKVIGKATAFLYCLLGVREVYAPVISRSAAEVLSGHGIAAYWDVKAEFIINRRKTGPCPMETAVQTIEDARAALAAVRETLKNMK